MNHGRNRLLKAARILVCEERSVRDRVIDAAQMLQASLAIADHWTPELRESAFEVIRRCHRDGALRTTMQQMDDEAVVQLASDILSVIEAAEGIPNIADLDCD